jgi:hypothetical protein
MNLLVANQFAQTLGERVWRRRIKEFSTAGQRGAFGSEERLAPPVPKYGAQLWLNGKGDAMIYAEDDFVADREEVPRLPIAIVDDRIK